MGRKRILSVDDPDVLGALKGAFFMAGGVDLVVVDNGLSIYEVIEEKDPDLVFLSPSSEGSGVTCCERVKNDFVLRETPMILVVSADQAAEVDEHCRGIFDDVLVKPFDRFDLISLCCRYLKISQRPHPRVATILPGRFQSGGRMHQCKTQDLSSRGGFIETSRLVPVGTVFSLEVDLPDDEPPFRCQAQVAWVNHPEWMKKKDYTVGMGLHFIEVDPVFQHRLDMFIATS